MPVRTTDIPYTYNRSTIKQRHLWVSWYGAWALLIIGWVGTFSTTNNGWDNVLAGNISITATIMAILIQAILTWLEWVYGDKRGIFFIRAIDASLTAYGYGFITIESMRTLLGLIVPHELTVYIGWLVIWAISFSIAWYPEHRLVQGDNNE